MDFHFSAKLIRALAIVLPFAMSVTPFTSGAVEMSAERILKRTESSCGQAWQNIQFCEPTDANLPSTEIGSTGCPGLKQKMDILEQIRSSNLAKKNLCYQVYAQITETCQGEEASRLGEEIARKRFLVDKMIADSNRMYESLRSYFDQLGCDR